MADSPGRRLRTTRPTAWAKNSGVRYEVIQARQAARGTSTPSEIIRTQTANRSVPSLNFVILLEALGSSDRISAGLLPVTRWTMAA